MTIEEYKEAILHKLEKAGDCEEVVQIINRSGERLKEKNLNEQLISHYLYKLDVGLTELSPSDFDSVHW